MARQPSLHRLPLARLYLLAGLSIILYLVAFILPYNLLTYVKDSPISLPEIAQRQYLPAATFLLAFATLFAAYGLAYQTCQRQADRRIVPFVLLAGTACAILLSLMHPGGAGDVIDYVSQGETLGIHGENPLVVPPEQVPGAVFARYSGYRHVTSNYGPLWTWISALVVRTVDGENLALQILAFKGIAVLAYLAQALLIYAILRRSNPQQAVAGLLLFAWNPLVLYEFAANGHNDATMMAFALLGILMWQMDRPFLMVAALTFSFLVKIPTAPLLPIFLLAAARRRGPGRPFWATLIAGLLLTAAITGLAYLSLPDPLLALSHLSNRAHLFTHSLPKIGVLLLQLAGASAPAAESIVRSAALGLLGAWYTMLLWQTGVHPTRPVRHAYHFVLFLLLFTTLWFQPWYVTWLVALAALFPSPQAPGQASLFSFTAAASYLVYGFLWFWIPPVANWGNNLGIHLIAVTVTYLAPWIFLATRRDRGGWHLLQQVK
ncbi:MAG: hypothetical protein JW900_03580 [Anaerolineae bacterium]|nr:hypothetical protein [Anaerolineae bacterium]